MGKNVQNVDMDLFLSFSLYFQIMQLQFQIKFLKKFRVQTLVIFMSWNNKKTI